MYANKLKKKSKQSVAPLVLNSYAYISGSPTGMPPPGHPGYPPQGHPGGPPPPHPQVPHPAQKPQRPKSEDVSRFGPPQQQDQFGGQQKPLGMQHGANIARSSPALARKLSTVMGVSRIHR